MALPSIFNELDKLIYEEFTRPRDSTQSSLSKSTIRTVQQTEDDRIKQEFEDYERRHYVVSTEAYISMLGCVEAYKPLTSRNEFLDNQTTYQASVSNDRMAVYLRGMYEIKELFICVRGTRPTSIEDILQDIQVIENSVQNSPFTIQYTTELVRIRNQFPSIPDDNIYISGHSLGSVYSLLASKILNVNGFGFNGASALLNLQFFTTGADIMGMVYDLQNIASYPNFQAYRIAGDPISLLSKWSLSNVVNINVVGVSDLTPIGKHSMDAFLKFCIPLVPLGKSSLSRARRSGKLDDTRDGIKKEGGSMTQLQQQLETNPIQQFLKYLNPFD